ncbi:MAG: hypothetical protein ACFFBV_10120 [Promethearchaeota archaeon]
MFHRQNYCNLPISEGILFFLREHHCSFAQIFVSVSVVRVRETCMCCQVEAILRKNEMNSANANEFCEKIQGENTYFPLLAGCGAGCKESSFSDAP